MSATARRGRGIFGRASKTCVCDGPCGRADHVFLHVPNDGPGRKAGRLLLLRDGGNRLWFVVITPLRSEFSPFGVPPLTRKCWSACNEFSLSLRMFGKAR